MVLIGPWLSIATASVVKCYYKAASADVMVAEFKSAPSICAHEV